MTDKNHVDLEDDETPEGATAVAPEDDNPADLAGDFVDDPAGA